MRRILLVGILLVSAGCQNFVGPFQPRSPRRVDDPSLTIPEQERRGRSDLPLPQQSPLVGPGLGVTPPNVFIDQH